MTNVTISRELLERIDESAICDGTDATISDDLFTQLVAALDAPRQPAGWKLVPERMHLDSSVIETIQAHCGDGQEDAGFGPYSDGVLWIGECEEEDGSKTYGLHIATADYPEEGSSTLVEFAAAPSAPKADDPVKQMLLEALEKVDSEHEILGWMKTCELRRGRGSFGIAVMSDERALDWQSHQKNLERLIELRHAAIAAARKGE